MAYNTKQQKAISDYLQNCHTHVTAAQIASYLGENGFKIGVATVYRHLDKLCSEGAINKIITDNEKSALFCCNHSKDPNRCFHIKCEICGSLADMDCTHLSSLYSHLQTEHNFTINPKKTLFYGICSECSKNNGGF